MNRAALVIGVLVGYVAYAVLVERKSALGAWFGAGPSPQPTMIDPWDY